MENMNHAHAYAWTVLAQNMGFTTLPSNYLHFQSINLDLCFRKEVEEDVRTISDDRAMAFGYDVPPDVLFFPGFSLWDYVKGVDAKRSARGEPLGWAA
jgi:hypothetical protein